MSKQDIETVLFDLINKYELQRTSVPITAKEFIEKPTQALTHLINKAREKDLQKYLDQMREIMAENFHYRTICGDIKDPSGKQDINELFIKYQELEPEREKFANYVEDRIKELEGKE